MDSAHLVGGNPGSGLDVTEVADVLGLAGQVDGEADLGLLEVGDDLLSQRLQVAKVGGVAEGLARIVGDDLDDLLDKGGLVGQQRILAILISVW